LDKSGFFPRTAARVLAALILMSTCYGDGPVKSTTTEKDLARTPEPPYGRSPFTKGSDGALNPADYKNKIPTLAAAPGCGTKVTAFNVYMNGNVRGGLKYNALPRTGVKAACLNNNDTTLGSCRPPGSLSVYFKFEAEVTFMGALKDGFYGQLITRPSADASNNNDVEFEDDTPKNDWVGKEWFLQPPQKREDFPTVEVDGQTVRWIDSPEAKPINAVKTFAIIFAGACGKLTNLEVFKLVYPPGGKATMTKITEADLKKEVKNFTFK